MSNGRRIIKKPPTTTTTKRKIEDNVAEKASTLMITTSKCGGKVLHTYAYVINNTWIIDSYAIGHMTFETRQISSLRHSLKNIYISIAKVIQPQSLRKDP